MIKVIILAAMILTLLAFTGCDLWGDPPVSSTPPPTDPTLFIGTWQLTIDGAGAPATMQLGMAVNQTRTAYGEISLEGKYGYNSRVRGSAKGNVFVGTVVYGNNATAFEMRLVTPEQATGTYSSGMNASDLIGVKMGN